MAGSKMAARGRAIAIFFSPAAVSINAKREAKREAKIDAKFAVLLVGHVCGVEGSQEQNKWRAATKQGQGWRGRDGAPARGAGGT